MGVLADEYIRLRPDVSRMPREIKRAGADAGRTFGGAFSGAAKKLLVAGALFAGIQTVTRFLADANEEARESIKVGKTTAQIIKSTGGAAKVSAQQVGDLASAISLKTGRDDEAIQSGANLLLTFKNVRNETGKGAQIFNRATAAALDLSATGFGSVDSSAKMLGKALNDPVKGLTALNRAGVTFTAQQKEQIKAMVESGNVLGAQKLIMAEVESQVGGVAAAQADWADKAKVAFENVKETVGNFLHKGLEPVSKWFVETGFPAVQNFFKKISSDKDLKAALTSLKDSLVTLTGKDFKGSLESLANSLPPVITAISDAITKYKEFSDAVDRFENKSFAEGDKRGGPVGQLVKDFGAGGTIERALIQFRGFIVRHVKQGWAAVVAAFIEDSSEVVAVVGGFVGRVVRWFAGLPGRVMAWVRRLWSDAKASFVKNHRDILAGVSRFLSRMIAFFTTWFTRLRAGWNAFWNTIKAVAQAAFNLIRSRITAAWNAIRSIWTRAQTAVRSTWSSFWTGVKTTASTAINAVRTTIDRVLGQIRTGFSRGVTAIGNAWNRIRTAARTPVAFVVNTVLDNGLLRAFRAVSKLVNYGPGENFHVSMARGGILPGYTPGKDVHRFYSATGGVIDLSGGEGIAVPQLAGAIGKKRWDAANREAMHGKISKAIGYLGGHFLGGFAPVPGTGRRHRFGYPWATWAGDFPNPTGTPVRAWASGRVAAVKNWNYSYGRHVRINHPGNKQTLYAHLLRSIVSVGQAIGRGNVLGYVNSTGNSTGPHLHFELKGGQGVLGGKNGAGALAPLINAAKYISQVTSALAKLKGIGGGQFGQMVAAAARLIGDKVKDKITSLVSSFNSANAGSGSGFTSVSGGSNRAIGKRMMLQRWPASQWPALNSLWTKESGWRTTARNPSSGAYGIPQSLPASKMASAGADWRTNPATQIKWGLGYIASRYGTPGAAWRHSQRTNWYGMGGVINEPVMGLGMRSGRRYGFGERGPETVTPGRGGQRPITIMIDMGEGLVQKIQGLIDENDEFRATVGRTR